MNVGFEENGENETYVGAEPVGENDKVGNHGPLTSAIMLESSRQDRELIEETKQTIIENDLDKDLQ